MFNFSSEQSSDLRLICMNLFLFILCFSVRKNNFITIFHIHVWLVIKNERKIIFVCFSNCTSVCCSMQHYAAVCSNKWDFSIGTLSIRCSIKNWASTPNFVHLLLLILLQSRNIDSSDFFTSRQKKDETANIRHGRPFFVIKRV